MGKRTYRKPGAKPDEASSRLVKKKLKAANAPQAAIQRFAKGAGTPRLLWSYEGSSTTGHTSEESKTHSSHTLSSTTQRI